MPPMVEERPVTFYTIGTAGHVDHGKSTLVKALTGEDPDRLPEEQARGMTIDLGFVHADLGDGVAATFIDVPGHERFIKTAVAGFAGIDLVLFVVAADEGVMPQTREHLAVLRYLGARAGVIAFTKADLVDDDWLALIQEDVRALFKGTFLENAPAIPVSAVSGKGIEDLKRTLVTELKKVERRHQPGPFRMAIDRVFTVKGFGTVVAGTVARGEVRPRDELEIQPLGKKVRVRGVQSRHQPVEVATTGMRAALNIVGVEQSEVIRGYEISTPGTAVPTKRLDIKITVEAGELKHRERVRFNKGTAEEMGRVLILTADVARPGEEHYAQMVLERPIVATRYEPFVVRNASTLRLIGGGLILDPFPTPHRRQPWVIAELRKIEHARGDAIALLAALLNRARGPRRPYRINELAMQTGLTAEAVKEQITLLEKEGVAARLGPDIIPAGFLPSLEENALEVVRNILLKDPLRESVSREEIRARLPLALSAEGATALLTRLAAKGELEEAAGGFRPPGYQPTLAPGHQAALEILNELFTVHPPLRGREEVEQRLAALSEGPAVLKYAIARGIIILLPEDIFTTPAFLEEQKQRIITYLSAHGTTRPADYKDVVRLSRKQVTALLDYFYEKGITIREAGTHRLAPKYLPSKNDGGTKEL